MEGINALQDTAERRQELYWVRHNPFEKRLGAPIDLGLESTLKPAIKDQVKKEIIYV